MKQEIKLILTIFYKFILAGGKSLCMGDVRVSKEDFSLFPIEDIDDTHRSMLDLERNQNRLLGYIQTNYEEQEVTNTIFRQELENIKEDVNNIIKQSNSKGEYMYNFLNSIFFAAIGGLITYYITNILSM